MKDTLRVLVSWDCNLSCPYCCNEIPEIRAGIRPARLQDLECPRYRVVCISGGEPLLFPDRVWAVCACAASNFIVLYTNGLLLLNGKEGRDAACALAQWGVNAINVGLHNPEAFDRTITGVETATGGLGMSVRYQAEDVHQELSVRFPDFDFNFWRRNDCQRDNEDRVILID